MILFHMKDPTSFAHVRSFEGQMCCTYREACLRRGLLEDEGLWNTALQEASECRTPEAMRRIFCLIFLFSNVSNLLHLWDTFKDSFSEDHLRQLQAEDSTAGFDFNNVIYNTALLDLQSRLQAMGGVGVLRFQFAISTVINSNEGQLFFLDAPGRTGKTFLMNLLLAKILQENRIAIAVASSGIAATLLHGSRTAHSPFKLPLDLTKQGNPTCNVSRGSAMGNLLTECSLIIWDEAAMCHKAAFEALERSLQDLRRNMRVMGGVIVLLSGNFRQTLPVIPWGTRADEVNASIKSSYLWHHSEKLHLSTNMRVHVFGDENAATFSAQLLDVSNGTVAGDTDSFIHLPFGNFVPTKDDLISAVFLDIASQNLHKTCLQGIAILAPHNKTVDAINNKLFDLLPGEKLSFKSIDTHENPDDMTVVTTEFLNSQMPTGLPPHELHLNDGAPIMLLLKLDAPIMCNGTRMIIKNIYSRVLQATILNGPATGQDVLITPMSLTPSDTIYKFKRLQFPIKLSFAMTINKVQGQSLQMVCLNLTEQVFSHGQLFLGCSHLGSTQSLDICASEGKTRNMAYKEALH
ncbi:uncharacterized protein LOC115221648 [Octopus sinensis]|uniref:ATP-dependent DNA helicase n=1 Tax=Octopus sinensis TaxID=2607531 RepID=A0A6P7TBM3_9MOLL|nr:uncharacterized protein LOC115221648 [Octopus sinensis]